MSTTSESLLEQLRRPNELGISPGTVYVAKSRILSRLRQELDGMVD